MELEKDTLRALIAYLTAHGYPPESLAIEYPIGKYRVDLAVIDLDLNELEEGPILPGSYKLEIYITESELFSLPKASRVMTWDVNIGKDSLRVISLSSMTGNGRYFSVSGVLFAELGSLSRAQGIM